MTFAAAVHAFVRSVPRGRVTTYGDVAWAVGRPGAARAVARVMAAAAGTERTPCHRVVRADGVVAPGPQAAGLAARLRAEGVAVGPDGRVQAFGRVRWAGPGAAAAGRGGKASEKSAGEERG